MPSPKPEKAEWTLYHNPKCSKSRCALELLQERGVSPKIVEYLKTPLTEADLEALLLLLGLRARDIVRSKEARFSELGLNLQDEGALIRALARYPELLERPIVVRGKRAVVGRPPENLLKLF